MQSFWCKSDTAHSTWLCAIIPLAVASFTKIKHESLGWELNATLPRLKETLVCFKQVFPHCRVTEKTFFNSSYSRNTRFCSAWGEEFVAAMLQLLLPLGFHRTQSVREGARSQSRASAEHPSVTTLPASVWCKESSWYQWCVGRRNLMSWWLITLSCGSPGIESVFCTG